MEIRVFAHIENMLAYFQRENILVWLGVGPKKVLVEQEISW